MPGEPFANFNARSVARLRASDRRRLKEKVGNRFSISSKTAELLVPAELLSARFEDCSCVPGVAYLTLKSVPLWFTLGENDDDLVPTVYTLWKYPDLLPVVSVPNVDAPAMFYGLLSAGNPDDYGFPTPLVPRPATSEITFRPSTSLSAGELVCITQGYQPASNRIARVGPALAVGRMDLPGDLVGGGTKGQVLTLLHVWEDQLWKMGGKQTPPAPRLLQGRLSREGDTDGKRGDEKVDTTAETFRKEQVTITGVNGSWGAHLHHPTIRIIETHKGKQEDVQGRGAISVDRQPTVRKAASSSISLSVTCRGNHTVTYISGFGIFHLDARGLAKELNRACGSSTTVQIDPRNSNLEQVMVQGKPVEAISEHLMAKGIQREWIKHAGPMTSLPRGRLLRFRNRRTKKIRMGKREETLALGEIARQGICSETIKLNPTKAGKKRRVRKGRGGGKERQAGKKWQADKKQQIGERQQAGKKQHVGEKQQSGNKQLAGNRQQGGGNQPSGGWQQVGNKRQTEDKQGGSKQQGGGKRQGGGNQQGGGSQQGGGGQQGGGNRRDGGNRQGDGGRRTDNKQQGGGNRQGDGGRKAGNTQQGGGKQQAGNKQQNGK